MKDYGGVGIDVEQGRICREEVKWRDEVRVEEFVEKMYVSDCERIDDDAGVSSKTMLIKGYKKC